jgi:hypothetical protein
MTEDTQPFQFGRKGITPKDPVDPEQVAPASFTLRQAPEKFDQAWEVPSVQGPHQRAAALRCAPWQQSIQREVEQGPVISREQRIHRPGQRTPDLLIHLGQEIPTRSWWILSKPNGQPGSQGQNMISVCLSMVRMTLEKPLKADHRAFFT